jgi:toxin ParE1/3/4
MKLITFHPEAEKEVTEAAQFYEARSAGLGLTLMEEVQRSLALIEKAPDASPKIGKRVRKKSLWRFPYNVVYAVYPDRIRIVAFAHQKRRPFYWSRRLRAMIGEGEGSTC